MAVRWTPVGDALEASGAGTPLHAGDHAGQQLRRQMLEGPSRGDVMLARLRAAGTRVAVARVTPTADRKER